MYGTINTGVFKSDLISKKIRAISAETIRYYGTSFSYWIAMTLFRAWPSGKITAK